MAPFILCNRTLGADIPRGGAEACVIDSRGETVRRIIRPTATLKRYARRYGLEWIAPVRLLALWREAEASA